jgi:hypothetical protein
MAVRAIVAWALAARAIIAWVLAARAIIAWVLAIWVITVRALVWRSEKGVGHIGAAEAGITSITSITGQGDGVLVEFTCTAAVMMIATASSLRTRRHHRHRLWS